MQRRDKAGGHGITGQVKRGHSLKVRFPTLVIACTCLLQAAAAAAQNVDLAVEERPDSESAVIRGRVTSAGTGQPLPRATVMLMSHGSASALVADERGGFEFTGLPAGRYSLRAESAGYLTFGPGQADPGDPPKDVVVRRGEVRSGVDVTLPRAAVIVVTITDETGAPLEGAWVQAQRTREWRGQLELAYSIRVGDNPATDDRGQIRLYDLAPGDYYVSATRGEFQSLTPAPAHGRGKARLQTFYPDAVRVEDARPVTVAPGDEINLTLAIVPTPVALVSGRVEREDGTVLKPYSLSIVPIAPSSGTLVDGERRVPTASDGLSFGIVLSPGSYRLEYHSDPASQIDNDFGTLEVTVSDADLTDVVLTVKPGAILKGRLMVDAGAAPGDWQDTYFTPTLASDDPWISDRHFEIASDGTFTSRGITGRGLQWNGQGFEWYLKAVMRDGKDVTDVPIDFSPGVTVDDIRVVVTRDHTEVTGTVRDTAGDAVRNSTVVVFSDDRDKWTRHSRYVGAASGDQQGRFIIAGLPPGRYRAAALDSVGPTDAVLRDRDWLERLAPLAVPLTLRLGTAVTMSLDLTER